MITNYKHFKILLATILLLLSFQNLCGQITTLTGNISGTTTICKNLSTATTTSPVIFTGQNGTLPYTFSYRINGGEPLTISTTGLNRSVIIQVPANTNTPVGEYSYEIINISDSNNIVTLSGTASVTVGLCTSLMHGYRGATLSNIYAVFFASPVEGASIYRFEITKVSDGTKTVINSSVRSLILSQLLASDPTGLVTYSTQYSIRVAVNNGDYTYGPAYSVFTPAKGTFMLSCGATLDKLQSVIAADITPYATEFRYKVTKVGGGTTIIEQPGRLFYLTSLLDDELSGGAGLAKYNSAYSITVQAKIDNAWTTESASCNYITPSPKTVVMGCGSTLANLNSLIYAMDAPLVSGYRFEITNGAIIRTIDATPATRSFSLTQLLGGAAFNTTYSVRVAVLLNGIPSNYSTSCNIITPTNCIGSIATPEAISGNSSTCGSVTNLAYSTNLVANASTYIWTVPTGWTITGGQNTNTIIVSSGTAGQNGNITVIAGDGCRTSIARNLAVTVNPTVLPTFENVGIIGNGTISYQLPTTSSNGISGTWSPSTLEEGEQDYTFTPDAEQCSEPITKSFMVLKPKITLAFDDDFSDTPLNGNTGGITPTVFTNDEINFTDVVTSTNANVTLLTVTPATTLTINPDGTITIPSGTIAGTYSVDYKITSIACPLNNDTATATINVTTTSAARKAKPKAKGESTQSQLTEKITVYPNPSTAIFTIDLTATKGEYNTIKVYNILGQTMYQGNLVPKSSNPIDLSNAPSGYYIAKVSGNTESATFQLIKK